MATFVIHLDRLQSDLNKLAEQLRYHEKKLLADNRRPTNYNLKTLIKNVENFKATFDAAITSAATEKPIDIYGSSFLSPLAYKYAEVTFTNQARLDTIRLLGTILSSRSPVRFFISDIKNDFDITVLQLVADIREIVKTRKEVNFEELFNCKENAWAIDSEILSGKTFPEYRYTWEVLTNKYFTPRVSYAETDMTDESVEAMVAEHNRLTILSKEQLETQLVEIDKRKADVVKNKNNKKVKAPNPAEELNKELAKNKEEMNLLQKAQQLYSEKFEEAEESLKESLEKSTEELEKALEESVERAEKIITDWLDKHSIGCLIEEAVKCIIPANVSCEDILGSLPPGEIFDRLSLLFPRGSDTFQAIEKAIENTIFENTGIPDAKALIAGLEKNIEDDKKFLTELERIRDNSDFPDQETLDGIENLKSKIESYERSLESEKQTLEQKLNDVALDLELSERQAAEIKAGGGNIAAILSLPQEGILPGPNALTGKILAAIDTIFPLEDICESIFNAMAFGSFGGMDFKIPEPKEVDDIFGGLSVMMTKLIASLIVEAIVAFIESILQDLINCDNLDNFISQMVNSLSTGEEIDVLKELFGGNSGAGIIENNYEQFVNTFATRTQNLLQVSGAYGRINVGISEQDIKNILTPSADFSQGLTAESVLQEGGQTLIDLAEASGKTQQQINEQIFGSGQYLQNLFSQGQFPDSNWMIDSTGNKFEIVDGLRVIDLQELDKFLVDMNEEAAEALKNNANASRQALVDAFGEREGDSQKETFSEKEEKQLALILSDEDKQNIKNEMTCIMKHLTSLLAPSQVLSLFAGNATTEVVGVAAQIVNICAPNLKLVFSTESKVESMLSTFGNIAGIDQMEDSILLLSQSEAFNEAIEPTRCESINNLEDFRKDLLSNVLEPQEAEQILDEMRKEKIQKLREAGNALLDLSAGQMPQNIDRDPNKVVLNALKSVLNREEIKESAPAQDRKAPKSMEKQIQSAIEEQFNSSPVVQKIFSSVINSLLRPISSTFKGDMDGFIDAFSDVIETEEIVQREITLKANGRQVKTINPVFKDLIDTGLIPALEYNYDNKNEPYAKMVDKSNFETIQFPDEEGKEPVFKIIQDKPSVAGETGLYVSGEASLNYLIPGLNGAPVKPVVRKVNKKDVGALFKKNMPSLEANAEISNNKIAISVSGKAVDVQDSYMEQAGSNIEIPDEVKRIMNNNRPSWNMSLQEEKRGGKTYSKISLSTNGISVRPGGQTDPFYFKQPFQIEKESKPLTDVANFLQEKYQTENKQKKEVFDDILFSKFKNLIFQRGNENLDKAFSRHSFDIYDDFIQSFLNSSAKNITETEILKDEKTPSGRFLKKIETLNFASECKNILDFEGLEAEYRKIYDGMEEPEISSRQRRGLEPRPSKSKETSLLIVSKIVIKLLCFETILKALPAFDYYDYSKNLVQNEVMINLICQFIDFDLQRTEMREVILEYIKKYYQKNVEDEIYEEITQQEKRQHSALKMSYPIELKKVVEKEFIELLKKAKQIIGEEEFVVSDANDFIRPIINKFKLIDVHQKIGPDNEKRIFSRTGITKDLATQRYLRLPEINEESNFVKNNKGYFTPEKIEELNNKKVVSFEEASEMFSKIAYDTSTDFKIYDCDEENQSLYSEPYRAGLRIVYVKKRDLVAGSNITEGYRIEGVTYPYLMDVCEQEKTGLILERERTQGGGVVNTSQYDSFEISKQEIKVNRTENASAFTSRNNENRYMEEFYTRLRESLLSNADTNLIFAFSLPLREMASMLIIHTKLVNNTSKMRYVLEPSKIALKTITKTLMNMGDKTKNKIDEMLANLDAAIANTGNPAGPIDFDALKMYARTPIQILKSLATIVDPNIAIADKINGGISLAGSLAGQKIFIPYSALSLGLLPAPIFGGLIPFIPPLTAYNVGLPLGPVFLALEPLLWDLPWFQDATKTDVCEDEE